MEILNDVVQDARALMIAGKNHTASATEEGIPEGDIQLLQSGIDDTVAKNKEQKDAVQLVSDLTAAQNKTMDRSLTLIRKVQNAAKAVYGEDNKQINKEFHIGGPSVTTVKAMTGELVYMKGVALKRKTDLMTSGMKDADFAEFDILNAELDDNDSKQENAKKKQKQATKVRDESLDALRKLMKKMRNKAKVIFDKKPMILVEFESITANRSGKKVEAAPAVNAATTTLAK